jgi:pimeloyl-ACP methyl ester carboxylesterase
MIDPPFFDDESCELIRPHSCPDLRATTDNKLDKGGHFAAWEQPQLFSEEVRAGFRPLRK